MSKEIWRAGFIQCPETCGFQTPAKDCQCACDPALVEAAHPYDILVQSEVSIQVV